MAERRPKTFSSWLVNDWPHFADRLARMEGDFRGLSRVVKIQGVLIILLLSGLLAASVWN